MAHLLKEFTADQAETAVAARLCLLSVNKVGMPVYFRTYDSQFKRKNVIDLCKWSHAFWKTNSWHCKHVWGVAYHWTQLHPCHPWQQPCGRHLYPACAWMHAPSGPSSQPAIKIPHMEKWWACNSTSKISHFEWFEIPRTGYQMTSATPMPMSGT